MKTIEYKVTVTFESDGRHDEETELVTALHLSMKPNFNTIDEGVSIKRVDVQLQDGETITFKE